MNRFDFTKRKFLELAEEQRHKKCAELLRGIYRKLLNGESTEEEISCYKLLMEWSGQSIPDPLSFKNISDLYHSHSQSGNVKHKEHNLLPEIRKGDKQTAQPSLNVAIYLDNIRSAHNVGSILRTVEAFSLGDVYFSKNTPFATHKQVQDASMGAAEWINCHEKATLIDLPKPIIVLETSDHAIPLPDYPFPDSFTLVIGNEEYGCSDETLKLSNALIEIPLRGRKNSLNVANAFAIAAAEISRQKNLCRN